MTAYGKPVALPGITGDGAALNRAEFVLPADGWFQVLKIGEFEHPEIGVQVIDPEALASIESDFKRRKADGGDTWPGMLVDKDHFSHDTKLPTEAMAWVDDVQARADGLWARGRWTTPGKAAVEGGTYRLVSPVLEDFTPVSSGRKRPRRMTRIALTNAPNMRGMKPITNRDNQDTKTMDYKKALCRMLDIPDTTPDAEIEAAANKFVESKPKLAALPAEVAEVKNRLTVLTAASDTLKGERDALKTEVGKLREAVAEQDLANLGPAIKNRDAIKARLIADRDGTLALLKDAGVETKTVPKPVHNRSGKNPGNPDTDENAVTEEHATRVAARANELMVKNRMTPSEAYIAANRELKASQK